MTCLYTVIHELAVPVHVTAICVVSFLLFISASISKSILVSGSTVSVTSDVSWKV